MDIAGLTIEYRAATGASFTTRATVPGGTTLAPHGFYLAASAGYTRATTPDLPSAWSTGFAGSGGHVRIVHAGTELDRLAWGGAVEPEGTAQPALADESTTTFERKATASSTATSMQAGGADATRGNGWDTDDNSADFVHRTPADPQSSASPAETP